MRAFCGLGGVHSRAPVTLCSNLVTPSPRTSHLLLDLSKAAIALGLLVVITILVVDGARTGESLPAVGAMPAIAPVVATVVAGPDGSLTVHGRGQPGTSLEILGVSGPLAATTVEEDGTWTLVVKLPPGQQELAIRTSGASQEAGLSVVVLPLILPESTLGQAAPANVAPQPPLTADAETVRLPCGTGDCMDAFPTRAPMPQRSALAPGPAAFSQPSAVATGQPEACRAPAGFAHTLQRGDRLPRLAGRFLGSASEVSCIVAATNTKALEDSSFFSITNPYMVPAGSRLWIPLSPDACGCAE